MSYLVLESMHWHERAVRCKKHAIIFLRDRGVQIEPLIGVLTRSQLALPEFAGCRCGVMFVLFVLSRNVLISSG